MFFMEYFATIIIIFFKRIDEIILFWRHIIIIIISLIIAVIQAQGPEIRKLCSSFNENRKEIVYP